MVWVLCCNLEMLSSWWLSAWSSAASLLCCDFGMHNTGTVSSAHVFCLSIKDILLTLCSFGAYKHTHFHSHYNCINLTVCIMNLYKHKLMKLIIGSIWWVRFLADSFLPSKLWPKHWALWVTAIFFACEILQTKVALSVEWIVPGAFPTARS